ncbi:MAG: hypothetical protein QGG25_05020, partial [Phycisphaerae bacterium]|nr:hypothetical protein [Phycisphaerae bacterium]
MTALFRCPQCNQALRNRHDDDPTKGCVLRCPECGARLVTPRPSAPAPNTQIETPGSAVAADGPHYRRRPAAVLPTMARCMPWLMSMFLHMALALIFMFVAMIVIPGAPDIVSFEPNCNVPIPDSGQVYETTSLPINHRTPRTPDRPSPTGADNAQLERAPTLEEPQDSTVIGP